MDSNFYTEFENNFRGSREQIMHILSNYDGLIDHIKNIDHDPSILDIGSGRGEWIQKCNAKGFKSFGIELDSKMVHDCKKLNLNIQEGDALSLMEELPKDSFSIVSAFHVIEHMSFDEVQKLLNESKRVLKPEGLLILETPSIDNLMVSTKSFYIDPTHVNPIHPDLLAFMSKRNGFTKSKYYFINGGPLQNSESDALTRVFNGVAQDLVFVASKSNLIDNLIFDDSKLIQRDMRVGITSLEAAIAFDDHSRNRYAQYDEAIFNMRKRIINLERQIQYLYDKNNINSLSILINICRKFKKISIFLTLKIKEIFRSCLRYFLRRRIYLLMFKKLYKIQNAFYIIRLFERIFYKLGFIIYKNEIVKKSKKIKEDSELVSNYESYLENYFNSSKCANEIFKDLNNYPKQ